MWKYRERFIEHRKGKWRCRTRFLGRRAWSDICFNKAIMGGIKERRNGQKDEAETKQKATRAITSGHCSPTRRRNKTWKKRQLWNARAFVIGAESTELRGRVLDFLRKPHRHENRRRTGRGEAIVAGPDQLRDESAGGFALGRRITIIKKWGWGHSFLRSCAPRAAITMAATWHSSNV